MSAAFDGAARTLYEGSTYFKEIDSRFALSCAHNQGPTSPSTVTGPFPSTTRVLTPSATTRMQWSFSSSFSATYRNNASTENDFSGTRHASTSPGACA